MKGILHKIGEKWYVEYPPYEVKYWRLPIHPDDVQYCEEGKEVEFEIVQHQPGIDDNGYGFPAGKPIDEAKLILPTKAESSWDDIFDKFPIADYAKDEVDGLKAYLKRTHNPPTPLKQ